MSLDALDPRETRIFACSGTFVAGTELWTAVHIGLPAAGHEQGPSYARPASNGCPGWDRTSDQVINSQKKSVSADVFHCLHVSSLTQCFSEGTMCRKLWTISRR
jgi:hypothetical protein